MQKYFDPEFNIVKVNTPDVIRTSDEGSGSGGSASPLRSERDNAYFSFGDISGSISF